MGDSKEKTSLSLQQLEGALRSRSQRGMLLGRDYAITRCGGWKAFFRRVLVDHRGEGSTSDPKGGNGCMIGPSVGTSIVDIPRTNHVGTHTISLLIFKFSHTHHLLFSRTHQCNSVFCVTYHGHTRYLFFLNPDMDWNYANIPGQN